MGGAHNIIKHTYKEALFEFSHNSFFVLLAPFVYLVVSLCR